MVHDTCVFVGEYARHCRNWAVVLCIQSTSLGWFMPLSSLHQFVTSSSSPADPAVQPGLGLSEVWYSWIISITNVGELLGALIMGAITRHSYLTVTLLMNQVLIIIGGVFYGIGKFGWMLLLGRFFMGIGLGSQQVFFRLYFGETSLKVTQSLPVEKQKKSTLKYTLFFFAFMIGTTFFAVGPGLSAVAAQLPVDQFRWPGWFLCIYSTFLAILVVVFFRERWTDIQRISTTEPFWKSLKRPRLKCPKFLGQLPIPLYTIVYIILAFLVTTANFSLIETIQNPILANNFGFDIKYAAYAILISSTIYIASNVFMYSMQRIRVDNRLLCFVGLLAQFTGALVASDWQSIRGDPCISVGHLDTTLIFDSVTVIKNDTTFVTIEEEVAGALLSARENFTYYGPPFVLSSTMIVCFPVDAANVSRCYWPSQAISMTVVLQESPVISEIISADCFTIDDCDYSLAFNLSQDSINTVELFCNKDFSLNRSTFSEQKALLSDIELSLCYDNSSLDSQCICESFNSMPDYKCFWNPNSRITNGYCERCPHICLSTSHSLNLIQLALGLLLLGFGYGLSRFTFTLIVSDCFGDESQGVIMGLLVASAGTSRLITPLWGNAVYVAAGNRTWLPMSICGSLQFVILVLFIVFYRTMRPKPVYKMENDTGSSTSCSTSDVSVNQLQSDAMDCEDISIDGVDCDVTDNDTVELLLNKANHNSTSSSTNSHHDLEHESFL